MASARSSVPSPTTMPTPNICDVHITTTWSILTAVCYGVLIPPTVIGNGLVVASFVVNPKIRTATNIFILGLAFSDLLIGSFSLPLWTYIVSYKSLSVGRCFRTLYQTYICMDILTGCASILQLTSIAIERIFFTVAPLRHRKLPRSAYYIMLICAWVFSIFVAALQPVQTTSWEKAYSIFLLTTCFMFPLFIIIFAYLYILKKARHQARPRRSSRVSVGSSGGYIKEFNIFFTVVVITGLFIAGWMPFFVVSVIASVCLPCLPPPPQVYHLVKFVKWMQYSSSSVNPYIYAYRNAELKRTFRRILRNCLCGCYKQDNWQGAGESAYKISKNRNSGALPSPGAVAGRQQVHVDQNGWVNNCFSDSQNSQGVDQPTVAKEYPTPLGFQVPVATATRKSSCLEPEVFLGPRDAKTALKPLAYDRRGSYVVGASRVQVDMGAGRDRKRSSSVNDILDQPGKYHEYMTRGRVHKSREKPDLEFHRGKQCVPRYGTRVAPIEIFQDSCVVHERSNETEEPLNHRGNHAAPSDSRASQKEFMKHLKNGKTSSRRCDLSSRTADQGHEESASYV